MSDDGPRTELNEPGWLAARRFGLPVRMFAAATERRLAGDWQGACAAAGFDVRFDLDEVGTRYGTAMVARVTDDLHHLVPDLVRWHLPRHSRGGCGLIEPDIDIALAVYGDPDGALEQAAALWLRTAAHIERPQRVQLRFGPIRRRVAAERWDQARYLWDDRYSARLLHRLGGGHRTPFFHRDGRRLTEHELPAAVPTGDAVALTEWVTIAQDAGQFEAAWAAAGIPADFTVPEHQRGRRSVQPVEGMAATVPALLAVLPALLAAADGAVVLLSSGGWRRHSVTVSLRDGRPFAARADRSEVNGLRRVPRVWWQRFPDLELLRGGRFDPAGLHPLVRAAMFPDAPDDGAYRPHSSDVDAAAVPVRCRGGWHRVGWRDGRVEPRDHTPEEAQRERVMRSLGGEVPKCFTVTERWQGSVAGRLPRQLRDLRHHGLSAIAHGDTDELLRLLELGVDPIGLLDRWNRGPLHHLAKVDGLAAIGPLLAAGLDINAKDGKGRTPLGCVLFDGGSAALVRAMLDAGADITAVDGAGETALHLLRSTDAATIVAWLLAAGVELETRDEYGRTPLLTQVLSAAPAEAIRATLDAGADPSATDTYTEQTIADLVGYADRDDLEFLVAAVAARSGKSSDD